MMSNGPRIGQSPIRFNCLKVIKSRSADATRTCPACPPRPFWNQRRNRASDKSLIRLSSYTPRSAVASTLESRSVAKILTSQPVAGRVSRTVMAME